MLSLNFVYLLTILRIGYCMLAAAGDSLRAFAEIVIIRLAVILARAGRIRFWPECVISAVAFFFCVLGIVSHSVKMLLPFKCFSLQKASL